MFFLLTTWDVVSYYCEDYSVHSNLLNWASPLPYAAWFSLKHLTSDHHFLSAWVSLQKSQIWMMLVGGILGSGWLLEYLDWIVGTWTHFRVLGRVVFFFLQRLTILVFSLFPWQFGNSLCVFQIGERTATILKHLFPMPKPDSKRIITFANRDEYISFRYIQYFCHTLVCNCVCSASWEAFMHMTDSSFYFVPV